jgi:drug/metabolite transporter (DMT)-like permease
MVELQPSKLVAWVRFPSPAPLLHTDRKGLFLFSGEGVIVDKTKASRGLSIALVLFGAASYGLLAPMVKLAYQDGLNELQVSAAQMIMGMALVWFMILLVPRMWSNPFKGPWLQLSFIGIFGLALTTYLYNAALSRLETSLATVLLFQFTWMTIALEAVVAKKRPSRYQIGAVVLVLLGTSLALGLSKDILRNVNGAGVLFGVCSGFTYSLFLFLIGRVNTTMNAMMKSAIMLTAAFPLFLILYIPYNILKGSLADFMLWGLILGLLGQVIPTVLFNFGIPRIGGSLAAVLGAIELPVAVVGALWMLGEPVSGPKWIGIVLILAGIIMAERKSGNT